MTTKVILVLPVGGLHSRPSLIPPEATDVKVYNHDGCLDFINVSYELRTDGMYITYEELERRLGMVRSEGFREGEAFALRQVEQMPSQVLNIGNSVLDLYNLGWDHALEKVIAKLKGPKND